MSLAIEDFRIPTGFQTIEDTLLVRDLQDALRFDLDFSPYFNLVEVDSGFLADFARGEMKLDDWIYLGAKFLVSGRVEREGDGILFAVDVTDIFRNRNIYNRDFVGSVDRYRYLAHQAAADLLLHLTGEEGCYFSKIVFSSNSTGNREIYACDFDGFSPVQITNDKSICILPFFSGAGKNVCDLSSPGIELRRLVQPRRQISGVRSHHCRQLRNLPAGFFRQDYQENHLRLHDRLRPHMVAVIPGVGFHLRQNRHSADLCG
jgi:TolB protein